MVKLLRNQSLTILCPDLCLMAPLYRHVAYACPDHILHATCMSNDSFPGPLPYVPPVQTCDICMSLSTPQAARQLPPLGSFLRSDPLCMATSTTNVLTLVLTRHKLRVSTTSRTTVLTRHKLRVSTTSTTNVSTRHKLTVSTTFTTTVLTRHKLRVSTTSTTNVLARHMLRVSTPTRSHPGPHLFLPLPCAPRPTANQPRCTANVTTSWPRACLLKRWPHPHDQLSSNV
jgi:hypothetical protein